MWSTKPWYQNQRHYKKIIDQYYLPMLIQNIFNIALLAHWIQQYKKIICNDQASIPQKYPQQIGNGFLNIRSSYKSLQLASCLLLNIKETKLM